MKTGALVLGVIGGFIALIYGAFGFGVGSLGDSVGVEGSDQTMLVSIALPVIALIGAGIVKSKPLLGAILMAGAAAGLVAILEFDFFSFVPVVLLGLGALLGFVGMGEGK